MSHAEQAVIAPAGLSNDELMRKAPKGKVTTMNRIREYLAKRQGAAVACPIVTGIHARIAAGAAGEKESLAASVGQKTCEGEKNASIERSH